MFITCLLTGIRHWGPADGLNLQNCATLEYTYIVPLIGWTVLGSKYLKVPTTLGTIKSVKKIWDILANKNKFDPFSHA